MNKPFFSRSTLVIALSIALCSTTATVAMADSQVGSSSKLEISKQLLRTKLAKLNFFSANFMQKVVSETGELLEQSSGKLAISKPNLANWHTLEPDELAIVSDGNDVWFYNPWIEQVSVYSLSAAIAKTPILLLTSKDESLWQQYTVTQENILLENAAQGNTSQKEVSSVDSRFVISAIDPNSQIKSLTLNFSIAGQEKPVSELSQFSFLDATGQVSHIELSNFDAHKVPDSSLFNFSVPEGVQIDDQRAN